LQCAGLCLDIAGFTTMTDRLESGRGDEGIEDLVNYLNRCFEPAMEEATRFGGEVASVTGDGLLILWTCAESLELAANLIAASRCALAIVQRSLEEGAKEQPLEIRIGVSVGEVFAGYLRGEASRGQLLVAGPLIADLFATCALAERGQVVLTAPAWRLIAADCTGTEKANRCFALHEVTKRTEVASSNARPPAPDYSGDALPPALPELIDARQLEWLAELRVASVMFVGFERLSCVEARSFETARQIATRLDLIAAAYSGLQERIRIDNHGLMSMISFGLPPRVGSYHPDQALAAAVAARRALADIGVTASIGVATGKVFRGPIGSAVRRDFTMYGNAVHRAVRLMAHATDRILCDEQTRIASIKGYRFAALEPLRLKGMGASAVAFEVATHHPPSTETAAGTRVVGRRHETSVIEQRLIALTRGHPSLTLLLGAAGIGKSSMLAAARERAAEVGIRVLYGCGTPVTMGAPYQAWRSVLINLLGRRGEASPESARARLLEVIGSDPSIQSLAPLLNAVIPLSFPENDVTRSMGERARAISTRELLTRLVARNARAEPTLIVLDDAHWLDEASIKMLIELWLDATGAAVLAAARPDEAKGPMLIAQCAGLDNCGELPIKGLSAGDSQALLAAIFGVERVADDLADWIYRATSGHPLFTSELAKVLHERGIVRRNHAVAESAVGRSELDALSLPGTVEGLVTDRLDRLGPVEQLTFKAASTIGIEFSFPLLQAIYPHAASQPALRRSLQRLVDTGLMVENRGNESSGPTRFAFAHATFRKAGYDHLPRGQKQALHLAIAEAITGDVTSDPRVAHATLAFHYRRAARYDKALHHLHRAGDIAYADGAFGVAAEINRQALDVCDLPGAAAYEDVLPGEWRCRLAICLGAAGDLDEARHLARGVLTELGYRWPEASIPAASMCFTSILQQIVQSWRAPPLPTPKRQRELDIAAQAAAILMVAYYYHASAIHLVLAALLATGLASQSAGTVRVTAAYGHLALLAGLLRLTSVRTRLLRRHLLNANLSGKADELRWYHIYLMLHHAPRCEWEQVEAAAHQRSTVSAEATDPYLGNMEINIDALVHYYRGEFNQARVAYEELRRRAERQHNRQHLAWSHYAMAECYLLPSGLVHDAIADLVRAQGLLRDQHDNHSRLICQGLLGIAYLRRGDIHLALAAAREMSALVETTPPNNFTSLEGYAGAVEVWLGLAHIREGERSNYHKSARRALKQLARYAIIYPIGRPRLWLYRGYLHWQRGSSGKAHACWKRALTWAERNRMPYEIARAAVALASHDPPSSAAQAVWLGRAEAAFQKTGANRILSPMETDHAPISS
jgi:class 3 adenylate cyclase/tetratricopeptide (TPR) repeat protein